MRCILSDEDVPFYRTFIQEFAVVTQAHTLLWARCVSKGFTSPVSCQTPTPCSVIENFVNSLLARNPSHQLLTIQITWPFSTWGLDLVGPFKKAKGGFTHIFIAVDKFIKWIEVKLVISVTVVKVIEFIREIMHQFTVPNNIITDNGTQLTVRELKDFCVDSSIKINYASVSHLQSNGQAK
jgi:hypothetical protein